LFSRWDFTEKSNKNDYYLRVFRDKATIYNKTIKKPSVARDDICATTNKVQKTQKENRNQTNGNTEGIIYTL
jgi:hypothetical protein